MKKQSKTQETQTQDSAAPSENIVVPSADEVPAEVPTSKELKETAQALVTMQPRDASGKFLSKTDKAPTIVEKRKEYVARTVEKVARLLEIPYGQLKIEDTDDAETALIKTLILGVYTADNNRGGLNSKVKCWSEINKVLGLGTVDKEEKIANTFSVVIVDPLAGLSPEERAEVLRNAVEYKPIERKKKPSFADSEVVNTVRNQNVIEGEYVADNSYKPRNPRGSA